MQYLIPFILALSLASATTPLNLIPYAYLSNPFTTYQQFQNTQTGEHAYSYAGGPSAKEEVRDADGVLRGSYSYIDANGILQSVFYVADENGFRVAATNLPTDNNVNIEPAHIVLARSAESQESSKTRKRRSIIEEPLRNSDQNEQRPTPSSPSSQPKGLAPNVQTDKKLASGRALYQPLLLNTDIPLATSHQSQVQVHSNARLDLTELQAKPVDPQPILPLQTILGGLPVLLRTPTYHENRIELHRNLGIEGARPKDSVKIDSEPLTLIQSSSLPVASAILAKQALPLYPAFAKGALPIFPTAQIGTASLTASVSSHGISQVHGPSRDAFGASGLTAKESIPILAEGKDAVPLVPLLKDASNLAIADVTASISSHGTSQIHGDPKLTFEPSFLFRTVPYAQVHPARIYG